MGNDRDDRPLLGISMRQPPAHELAEQALLGALLANNRALDHVSAFLRPEHFRDPANSAVYAAILRRVSAGDVADAITLRDEFAAPSALDEVGGPRYLTELLGAMVATERGTVTAYARVIRDTWLRRELIALGERMIEQAYASSPESDGDAQAAAASEALSALAGDAEHASGTVTFEAAMDAAIDAASAAHRGDRGSAPLDTGLPTLDAMWGGLWPGQQNYIVARSRVGKSALMMQIVRHVAGRLLAEHEATGEPMQHVQVFSLEMTAADLATGSLAAMTGISADDIRCGHIGGNRAEMLAQARAEFARLPILIEDAAGLTLTDIQMRAHAAKRRKRVRLIAIDHRDLIERPKDLARLSPMEWLPKVTRTLKALAKALDVPVVLLMQLNKGVESREDSRPRLTDLPYSGEQDADAILAVHRPELYAANEPPPCPASWPAERKARHDRTWRDERETMKGVAEFSFLKRRFGPTRWATLRFDPVPMVFRERESDDAPADLPGDLGGYAP